MVRNSNIYGLNFGPNDIIPGDVVIDTALPETPLVSVVIEDVISQRECAEIMDALRQIASKVYGGAAASTLSSPIGLSAWDQRYNASTNGSPNSSDKWSLDYFRCIEEWDQMRRDVFGSIIGADPEEIVANIISTATQKPVTRAIHPRMGRRMGAGMVRSGVADDHYDWAPDDLQIDAIGHLGVVICLETGPRPIQRVYDFFHQQNGLGNYGLDVPAGTPYLDVPTPVGALCLLNARRTHRVVDSPNRTTYAEHLALLRNGSFAAYS